ncbi:MAG: EamA family transporter [Frankiales bacterium]|nr:EamA family transporter [Frankiales bacterium]
MPPAAWKTWTALGLVYVVWGSTYLAISYVVDGLPPLLTAAARFLMAAALIGSFVLVRRGSAPFRASGRQWLGGAVIGLLLLLGGNGGVTMAEDHGLPSGLTALLIAGVPLYVVMLRALLRDRPSGRTVLGVTIGFVGLGVLLLPGTRPEGVSAAAAVLVLGSSALWAVGSVLATRIELPKDPLVTTVAEMLGGAVGLAVVGLLRGEQLPTSGVKTSALLALGYLVVFGSVVAFTAYSWLLGTAPVSKVATYAYVNPVVAVALGALIAGEDITTTSVVGGLITVLAVAIVVSESASPPLETPDVLVEPAQEPDDRHGRVRSSRT